MLLSLWLKNIMIMKRKIIQEFIDWKNEQEHKPLIVKGCRQCGKTYSVLQFANENYENVVYIDFFRKAEYAEIFSNSLEVDDLVMYISSMLNVKFKPGKTCLVFDEIQQCPNARASLKFFCLDGRYDVICTGSLLGLKGYRDGDDMRAIPVGYETSLTMHPMDFEEFLWANGIDEIVIAKLQECLEKEIPVPAPLHSRFRELLLQYVVVGGMPEAVKIFIETHDMAKVLKKQRDIVRGYKDDMVKYADKKYKPNIRECFDSIPKQLSRENKKFKYSEIKRNARADMFLGCLQWIEDAGIIERCYNLSITELPLDGNAVNDVFKVYMADTGLFVSMLSNGTQSDILMGNLYGYKGAIFENLAADFLGKMERRLFYFHKDSGLEIDFVMRYKGECVLLEVKAESGNAKSMKTVLKQPEKYHVFHSIKLGDYNVGRDGQTLTLPLYMGFLLRSM